MTDLTAIRDQLADRRIGAVASATGLSRQTIYDILSGANRNPTLATLEKLCQYLQKEQEK